MFISSSLVSGAMCNKVWSSFPEIDSQAIEDKFMAVQNSIENIGYVW